MSSPEGFVIDKSGEATNPSSEDLIMQLYCRENLPQ